MLRRRHAVTALQAAEEAPGLGALAALARESAERLALLRGLVPAALHASLRAGPVVDGEWCLLAGTPAAAAKLRQLAPALEAHLRSHGRDVQRIRVKVSTQHPPGGPAGRR